MFILIAGGLTVAMAEPAQAAAPASISMVASSSPVASGSQLTYTIEVANTSGATLSGVMMTDQTEGMTGLILTSSVGSCSTTANLVTCQAGTLAGSQTWRVTIRGLVTAANGETLNNTATVAGTQSSNTFTTSATLSTLVSNQSNSPLPELSVSVQGPAQIGDSQDVRYDLTVNNTGNANATDITVIDTLPNGFSYTSASGTSLFVCGNTPSPSLTVTCTGGRVNAGTNATITILAKSGVDPGPFKNTAVVDPYNTIPESNDLNNTGALVSNRPAPPAQTNVTITMADQVDPIRPGDVETYQLHVVNTAATRADSLTIVDSTQGLDAASVSATTTKGDCVVAAPKVTCTQTMPTLRLDSGEALDITITGKVVATAGSLLTNTATVNANVKNTGVSNTATTTTTVRPGVDLTVVQSAMVNHSHPPAPDAFRARDDFNYLIAVGNSGLDDASNVVVREPLPTGMLFKSFTGPTGVDCGESNAVVTCTGLTVGGVNSSGQAGGTVQTIVLTVIAPPTIGGITATVTVDPTNAILESDETNNTFTTSTDIATGVDLTTMQSSDPVVAPNGTLVYTITVFNTGTQDTTKVVMRDVLPLVLPATSFREAIDTSDHNFTCQLADAGGTNAINCIGGNLRGTLDHTLPVDFATIKITMFAPGAPGLINNQVRIDPDNLIPEIFEDNNVNTLTTDIEIGGCCAYRDLTIVNRQVFPASYVAPSGDLEYDVTVSNVGSEVATAVVVRDVVPVGSTVRFAQDTLPGTGSFNCSVNSQTITCTGGTLDGTSGQTPAPDDSSRTIHIGLFAPAQPNSYTNQAVVDPDDKVAEADETNNADTETAVVALGGGGAFNDLAVDATQTGPAVGGPVVPSGVLQYTLTVHNNGSAVAFNVALRDVLPAGSRFRSAFDANPGDGAFTCLRDGDNAVNCTGGTVDGSNNDTPTVGDDVRTVVINLFAPTQPDTYVDQAQVDPDNKIAEADETNNTGLALTTVAIGGGGNYTDLTIDDLTASTTSPSPQQANTYTITVENTGTDAALGNVKVADFLPQGATLVDATGTGDFTCSFGNATVTCQGSLDGSLDQAPNVDTTATITIKVKAPKDNGSYTNQVRIDPDNDIPEADETNNSKTLSENVQSKVDLTPTVSTGGLTAGAEGDLTFSVSADFAADATDAVDAPQNFLAVAQLPDGVIPLAVTSASAGWSCDLSVDPVNTVTCVGSLSSGMTTASFTVHVNVTTTDPNVVTVVADPDNRITEINDGNNTVSG